MHCKIIIMEECKLLGCHFINFNYSRSTENEAVKVALTRLFISLLWPLEARRGNRGRQARPGWHFTACRRKEKDKRFFSPNGYFLVWGIHCREVKFCFWNHAHFWIFFPDASLKHCHLRIKEVIAHVVTNTFFLDRRTLLVCVKTSQ